MPFLERREPGHVLAHCAELVHRQPGTSPALGDDNLHLRVVAGFIQAVGHLPPRRIEPAGELGQVLARVLGQGQARQDVRAHRLPPWAVQQPGARLGPPVRRGREYVAPVQGTVQLLQHAHHVRVAVDRALGQFGVGEHRPLPHRGHQVGVDVSGQQRPVLDRAARQRGQTSHRLQDAPPTRGRAQRLRLTRSRAGTDAS